MFLYSWPGGSPEATLMMAGVVAGIYAAVIWVASIAWTARDISQRTESAPMRILAGLLVTLTFLPGLAVYLILRPRHTIRQRFELQLEEEALLRELGGAIACPSCARSVRDDFIVCPACQAQLKVPCTSCAKPLLNSWQICPYCAKKTGVAVPVAAPERMREPRRRREPASPVPATAAARPPAFTAEPVAATIASAPALPLSTSAPAFASSLDTRDLDLFETGYAPATRVDLHGDGPARDPFASALTQTSGSDILEAAS